MVHILCHVLYNVYPFILQTGGICLDVLCTLVLAIHLLFIIIKQVT